MGIQNQHIANAENLRVNPVVTPARQYTQATVPATATSSIAAAVSAFVMSQAPDPQHRLRDNEP